MMHSIQNVFENIQNIEKKISEYPNYIRSKFSLIYQDKLSQQSMNLNSNFSNLNPVKKQNQNPYATNNSLEKFNGNIFDANGKKNIPHFDFENFNEKDNFKKSYEEIIQQASAKYGLPSKLIQLIIKHESNFNPKAVSSAGAKGLMQLMPATAKSLGVKNVFDPYENIMAGSKYFKYLYDVFKGDLKLALASYNAGPNVVSKLKRVPNIIETQNYVKSIMNDFYENQQGQKL